MISWGVWAVRLLIALFGAGGVAFAVANYVTNASRDGLTTSVETLATTVSDLNTNVLAISSNVAALNQTITTVNTTIAGQLLEIDRSRGELAVLIATEVGKLQTQQGIQGSDLSGLRDSLSRIEKTVSQMNQVRLTYDGGKTFKILDPEDAINKFGDALNIGESYILAPWSFNEVDPPTGHIELPKN